ALRARYVHVVPCIGVTCKSGSKRRSQATLKLNHGLGSRDRAIRSRRLRGARRTAKAERKKKDEEDNDLGHTGHFAHSQERSDWHCHRSQKTRNRCFPKARIFVRGVYANEKAAVRRDKNRHLWTNVYAYALFPMSQQKRNTVSGSYRSG